MIRPPALLFALFCCLLPAARADEPGGSTPAAEAVPIFDGKSFNGWFFAPHVDPRAIAAMAPAERAAYLEKHAAEGRAHWRVEQGDGGPELVNDGEGPYLWTAKDYADFELSLDWKITAGTDSGVYIRGCPQVQIWDPDAADPRGNGNRFGSGGLWNNPKSGPNNRGKDPSERADKPMGEWNTFVIRVVGSTVTVHLNGVEVVNEAQLENYWDRSLPLFPVGPIILQTHGGETRWRNVVVREIPRAMPESGHLDADGVPHGDGWTEANGATAIVGADAHGTFGPLDGGDASVTIGTRVGTPGPSLRLRFSPDGAVTAENPLSAVSAVFPTEGDDVEVEGRDLLPCVRLDIPAAAAAFDPAETSRVYLRATDGCVTAHLNGTPILTAVDAPEPRETPVPLAVEGPGAAVAFVRAADDREPPGDETGFAPVPFGPGLVGWEGDRDGYAADDGVLTCRGGNLYLAEEYGDFTARFEFRLPPGGNNGVGLRFVKGENAAYSGMESQILDNAAQRYASIQPWQAHGSIYGVAPALRGYLAPVGHWNREEIRLDGDRVRVTLNGKTIVDVDVREAVAGGAIDGKEHAGLLRPAGAFGFLGHGAPVAFRNLRIKTADAAPDSQGADGAGE